MKRRCKSAAEYSVTIGSSGTAGNWAKRKTKRVRFVDTETDSGANYVSMRGPKTTQAPSSDAPKTSEYAYFTNIKNGIKCHSVSLHNKTAQLKSSKPNYLGRENIDLSEMLKPRTKNLTFSVSGKMEGPSNHHFPLSPLEPNQRSIKDLSNHIGETSLLPSENAPHAGQSLSFSVLDNTSEPSLSGNQCTERGIFSVKRQRIRQLAHNSNSEVENFHHEGAGLISSLLSRLFGKGKDSSKRETVSSYKSPTFCESENLEKELYVSHPENWIKEFPKIGLGSSSDGEFSERDAYFSGFHFPNYGIETHFQDELMDLHYRSSRISSTKHALSFFLPFGRRESSDSGNLTELNEFCFPIEYAREEPHCFLLEWDPEGGKGVASSFVDNHDPSKFLSPALATTWNVNCQKMVDHMFDAEESTWKVNCQKMVDNIFDAKESALATTWNVNCQKMADNMLDAEESALATTWTVNCQKMVDNMLDAEKSALATTWNVNCPKMVDYMLNAEELCSPSLLTKYNLNYSSIPKYCLTSFLNQELVPNLEEAQHAVAITDQFSLTFPCTPKCKTLVEENNAENILRGSNIILSYRNQNWLKNKFRNLEPRGDFWPKCLHAPNFSQEPSPSVLYPWEFPQIDNSLYSFSRPEETAGEPFTPFSKGITHSHSCSLNLKSHLDRINQPLLLGNVSNPESDHEFNCEDDNKLKYF